MFKDTSDSDFAKAIALSADAIAIGSAAMMLLPANNI